MNPAEINYPIHEKELLAIEYTLQTWRVYIDNGFEIIVWTDHESLKYLATMRNPSKRLARWLEEFGEYALDIRYRKGQENMIPDAISRRPDWMGKGPRDRAAIVATIRTANTDEDDWADHMLAWIDEKVEPPEFCRKTIFEKAEFDTRSYELVQIHEAKGKEGSGMPHRR